MKRDLPAPEQIIEELANKVAVQIDRLAPVAFDRALDELIRYHRFLLELNAAAATDGTPFSYAEVGSGFLPRLPHLVWIGQYRRLFERAANRLGDDTYFIERLAGLPIRLLPKPGDARQPPGIISAILNLGPGLAHRLEAWVTKRAVIATVADGSSQSRLSLAGSDSKAYAGVLKRIVGQWETLLQIAPSVYGWKLEQQASHRDRWSAYGKSWYFLSNHLQNTAYMLATAVWNEDEIGVVEYCDALVRWPEVSSYQRENSGELLNRRLIYPDLLGMDWPSAVSHLKPNLPAYMEEPSPKGLFSLLIQGAHHDCVLLAAATLLSWHMESKVATDIAARTALALLRRDVADAGSGFRHRNRARFDFRSIFLDIVRIELAGERYQQGGYGSELDRLVSSLDSMSERSVVPGRIYTPSTMDDREELRGAFLAMLLAVIPLEGDDGFSQRLGRLMEDEAALPQGDRSVRSLLQTLEAFQRTIESNSPSLRRGAIGLSANVEFESAVAALKAIIETSLATIRAHRSARLERQPVDPAKMERIRSIMDSALLTPPADIPFFRGFALSGGADAGDGDIVQFDFGWIGKGQLVEPPMESEPGNFVEALTHEVCQHASNRIWRHFASRAREKLEVSVGVDDEAFWRVMKSTSPRVGVEPVLLVSRQAEERLIRRSFVYPSRSEALVRIERKPRDEVGGNYGSYVATIEGIDVYGVDFPVGTAWLFSAQCLRSVGYTAIDGRGRHVQVAFAGDDEERGVVQVRYLQSIRWANSPILEMSLPTAGGNTEPQD